MNKFPTSGVIEPALYYLYVLDENNLKWLSTVNGKYITRINYINMFLV